MKILVADDHRLVISGVRAALAGAEDIEIVGEARDGSEVLPLVRQLQPDVVLLDVRMPRMDGLACLQLLRERHPKVHVVVLSVSHDPADIRRALELGAASYVVKSIDPRDLASALRQAVEGAVFHPVGIPDDAADANPAGLTERELTILRAAARGLSNRAIARDLWVTEQTVKFHMSNILRKLGVTNRTEAARQAFKLGLVASPVVDAV